MAEVLLDRASDVSMVVDPNGEDVAAGQKVSDEFKARILSPPVADYGVGSVAPPTADLAVLVDVP
jgi:hypothetical protein